MKPAEISPTVLARKDQPERNGQNTQVSCPVCGGRDKLKHTRGMLLCTRCYWATDFKLAS